MSKRIVQEKYGGPTPPRPARSTCSATTSAALREKRRAYVDEADAIVEALDYWPFGEEIGIVRMPVGVI